MRTQRQLRVGEEIRHSLASVLMRGDVPWLRGFVPPNITITEVQVSPDLQNATAFVMPLAGEKMAQTVKSMNEIAGYFRHSLAQMVKLRFVPKLTFKPDESFDYALKIEKILHNPKVAKDLAPPEEE